MRIEDTDQERSVEGAVENIIRTLEWAGITVDEGPTLTPDGKIEQKGSYGPYVQSERLDSYKKYATELVAKGAAYYAFDSSEELEAMRKRQEARKRPSRYERDQMRNQFTLSESQIKSLLDDGTPHVVRLIVPSGGEVIFNDLIKGEIKVKAEEIDEQVLLKSDGFPTYHLAVVVDDYLMKITHVIRGEDWLPSTPKHVLLYQAFGWELPQFAHLPLLVDAQKQKLSKRKGDVAVEDFKNKGYLPEAFVNFIVFLGWNPGTEQELFSMDELIKEFSLEKVSKSSAVFNTEKLDWYNKEYLKRLPLHELVQWAEPWIQSVIPSHAEESRFIGQRDPSTPLRSARDDKAWLEKVIGLERERVTTLAQLPEAVRFVFELPEYQKELLVWRKGTLEEAQKILPKLKELLVSLAEKEWNKVALEQKIGEWIKQNEYQTGSVLWPLRVALSGQQNSPGPYEIAEVLGKDESLKRLTHALTKLG